MLIFRMKCSLRNWETDEREQEKRWSEGIKWEDHWRFQSVLTETHTHTHTRLDQEWWASFLHYANGLSDDCIMSLHEAVISSCVSGSVIGRDEVLTSQSQGWVVTRRLSALLPWQHDISLSCLSLVFGFSCCNFIPQSQQFSEVRNSVLRLWMFIYNICIYIKCIACIKYFIYIFIYIWYIFFSL